MKRAYVTGFVLSILLTLAAYVGVDQHLWGRTTLIAVVSGLAVVQALAQLYCFMHLGQEKGPRWRLGVLVFMLGVVVIVIFGSLWIMTNLNYHMSPDQVRHYLDDQDGL